ncbi:IclR family transcriptional regulator [Celeribacter indicus]|uniref:Transcriptional regulator n=1 Tax=Celeribacter indicus TaxID=1208324 RepID=A0A0B5E2B6_9RHOB|nr:helix-turn-helix domain-containing protein [Celeribacter indicus]AJE47545.1 transcriptional regulator [Celeribacter indicus]SDW09781.1 transcriptional regulator, IclR family [Celeribacter indicus]
MTPKADVVIKKQAPTDKAFAKGLTLLQRMTECDGSVGVSDLAASLDLTKSNVHRLLQTLMAFGFVEKDAKSRYRPSLRYWELGYEVWLKSRAGQAALDDADGLAAKTGCLVHVTLADAAGEELVLYERIGVPIAHPMRRLWPTGARVPVWRLIRGWSDFVAFQVAYIAALPEAELAAREAEIRDHLAETDVSYDSLLERVGFARESGYAENLGGGLDHIQGTASAFLDESGRPVGVLSTIFDRPGDPDERLAGTGKLNRLYAHSISHSLGYRDTN